MNCRFRPELPPGEKDRSPSIRPLAVGVAALASIAVSCSKAHYLKSADKETSRIIANKGSTVPNMEEDFSIIPPQPASLSKFKKTSKSHDFLGEAAPREKGATQLSLADSPRRGGEIQPHLPHPQGSPLPRRARPHPRAQRLHSDLRRRRLCHRGGIHARRPQ